MNRNATTLLMALLLTCFGTIVAENALSGTPVSFIRNDGQFGQDPLFRAEAGGVTLFFEANQVTYVFARRTENQERANDARMFAEPGISSAFNSSKEYLAIKTEFLGANENVEVHGDNPSGPVYNYLLGNNRDKWITNTRGFSSLIYENIYPGINLKYYDNGHSLKYDIIVNPGADLSQIRIRYKGIEGLNLEADGNLDISTVFGNIGEKAPHIFQEKEGKRQNIDGRFEIEGSDIFGFAVDGQYDSGYPLIIDPEYIYGTFLGGTGLEWSMDIAEDNLGKLYIAGSTESVEFPTTPGVYDSTLSGKDVFVTCLDPTQLPEDQLIWSTFVGGDTAELAYEIELNSSGEPVIGGYTASLNFPITAGAIDTSHNGGWDAFVARLNTTGTSLEYSTYIGGSMDDWVAGLGIDDNDDVFAGGTTRSTDFPTTTGAFQEFFGGGQSDSWVAKISMDGNGINDLIFSTYIGGSSADGLNADAELGRSVFDLVVTSVNDAIITGIEWSTNFPTTPGSYDTSQNGGYDCFVTRIDATGSSLVYSTFLGGVDGEGGMSITVDQSDAPICAGYTYSQSFPVTPGAFDSTHNDYPDFDDVFIAKFDLLATQLEYSTFLGGGDYEASWGRIDVGPDGDLYVSGFTKSENFPVSATAFDRSHNGLGSDDAWIVRFRMAGQGANDLIYSTFLGGQGHDDSFGLTRNPSGIVTATMMTLSADIPYAGQPYDSTHAGDFDSFIARFDLLSTGNCDYFVGDVNGSDDYNGLDITYGVSFFKGGPAPAYDCECPPHGTWYVAGDVNASCSYNGLDITYGVAYFKGGSAPLACPDCPPVE